MVDKTTRLVVDVEAQEAHPTAPCTDDTEDFGRTQKGQLRTYNVLDARAVQVQDQLFKFQVAAERVTVARARGDVRGGQGAAAGVARTQFGRTTEVDCWMCRCMAGSGTLQTSILSMAGRVRCREGQTGTRHLERRRVRRRVYRSSPRAVAGARRRDTVTQRLRLYFLVSTLLT